jgi:hypothetical protein
MSDTIYLHYHYDYDNSVETLCKDAKCYQKKLEAKKALQEYQDQIDRDLQMKENLRFIEDSIQDLRIDDYR